MSTGYPESMAVKTWKLGPVACSLVRVEDRGHYCGYARFKRRPAREQGSSGIMRYVPVHGGITYAEQDTDGSMVYGFDCAHANDENRPELKSEAFLMAEVGRMVEAIKVARAYEARYLRALSNKGKARVLDQFHKHLKKAGIPFTLTDSFGAMIAVLCGKL